MDYKLVVCDMDGTLLNSEGKVSDENKETLEALQEKGVHVAVATGRIFTSAKVYAKYLRIVTPIIACNGALVKDLKNNENVYESPLSKEDCLKIVDICRKKNLYFHFYSEDTFYTEKLENKSLKYSEWNKTQKEEDRIKIETIKDAKELLVNSEEKIYKFLVIDENTDLLEEVREELVKAGNIECSKSWYNNMEVMNRGVKKGTAVKNLAESLGIKPEEIVCIGDNENDISMLEYAGMGIAMGNAEDKVKQKANYVTDTNDESGVAKALKKFFF
ncbi:MAG: Cof-type HAD-IIB family hydrolase [Bacillota bacterium]